MGATTFTCELHGIPAETLRRYLARLGAEPLPTGDLTGPGWTARLIPLPDYRLGQATFCSFRVELQGEDEVLRQVWPRFELLTQRPGG